MGLATTQMDAVTARRLPHVQPPRAFLRRSLVGHSGPFERTHIAQRVKSETRHIIPALQPRARRASSFCRCCLKANRTTSRPPRRSSRSTFMHLTFWNHYASLGVVLTRLTTMRTENLFHTMLSSSPCELLVATKRISANATMIGGKRRDSRRRATRVRTQEPGS